jgi:hypothetical protein
MGQKVKGKGQKAKVGSDKPKSGATRRESLRRRHTLPDDTACERRSPDGLAYPT